MGLSLGQPLSYASAALALTTSGGVPALAWRYPTSNTPVLKAGGGYWLKAS